MPASQTRWNGSHLVDAERGSFTHRALRGGRGPVVTLHHQAVDEVAPGFRATAWAPDGTVEAVESVDGRCVGVQFHPEFAEEHQRFFDLFVEHCRRLAGLPDPVPVAWRGQPTPKAKKPPVKAAPTPTRTALRRDLDRVRAVGRPRSSPVSVKYRCFRCDVDFDSQLDWRDHMTILHDVEVLPDGRIRVLR